MRRLVLAFIFLTFSIAGIAQNGNEWIQSNQAYFKIPVASQAIYRLTFSDLYSAGFPTAGDPRRIQLFHRGVEQALHVSGESDGVFNPADFLEFFGNKNDGTLDAGLYANPAHQPHNYYNLYSDSTSYFLTLGTTTGKRMSIENASDVGLPIETFHRDEKLVILASDYSGGIDYGSVQLSTFDQGEGWMGAQILQGQTGSYLIESITQTAVSSGDPSLELLLTGRGPMPHVVEIYAGARFLGTVNFTGYQTFKYNASLLWTDISGDGKVTINIKVIGAGGNPDRVSPNYLKIGYPQQLNMESKLEKVFKLSANPSDVILVDITNAPTNARIFDITNAGTVKRISSTQGTSLRAVVPNAISSRSLLITNSTLKPSVKRIAFRSIQPTTHNYIIITHPSLRKPALGFTDPVKAFAEYRSLPEGGEFDTLVVNIDQVYNQFSYGEKTPLAIYHFVKFLSSTNSQKYLFLVGKGLDVYYQYHRNPTAFTDFKDLVPTAGYPASDMAFSAPNGAGNTFATGRLTAMGPLDVAAYLKKVKETEALPFDNLRRKNILHLSGGIYQGEPQAFRSYLADFATIAEDHYLGAHVTALAKQSTDIELVNVANEVNKGVSLITFFGHSASTTTDFDIGRVTDPVMGYANQGKYPLLLMNGCSAGSFFLNTSIFGESWINTPNRGAMGVIAHSSLGFAYALRRYSSIFYEVSFGEENSSARGLGDIQKEVASRYFATFGVTPVATSQVQQMVLLGDPAMKLFGASKPDYDIADGTVTLNSFTSEPVTALSDSFRISMIINNYGKALPQPFTINVTRKLNDGSEIVYDSIFNSVLFSDTISFTLPGKIENGFGNNLFTINVDGANEIDELQEGNNEVTIEFFIPLSGTLNLYPDNFAIINKSTATLTWQHTDQLSSEREFLLELDTLPSFTSLFKKQFTVLGTVLGSKEVEILDQDTLTYYWRTKLANPSASESQEWDLSSFTYIKDGLSGWGQVHFPQFESNPSEGLVKDPILRRLEFEQTTADISIKTFGANAGKAREDVSIKINGAEYNLYLDFETVLVCRNNTINLVAFDKKTTQPYAGVYLTWTQVGQVGGRAMVCGRDPYGINSYQVDELMYADFGILNYVDNVAPGDSVVLYTIGDAGFSLWPQAAKEKLGQLGISVEQINELQDGEPVIIFARKGTEPGSAKILRSLSVPANSQMLEVNATMTGRSQSGTMSSNAIGPASAWGNVIVQREGEPSDELLIDVIAISKTGIEELVYENVLINNFDISSIDATIHPYIKLQFTSTDEIFVTSGQLKKWIVTFQPVAEGLILFRGARDQQSVNEGKLWNGPYSFVNISDETFPELLEVQYKIFNTNTFATSLNSLNITAPLPRDTTKFFVPIATEGQDGVNTITVFVNPKTVVERNYDNNVIVLNDHLDVLTDRDAPVLTVTFDGKQIENNAFVSPSPKIEITLWDNNPDLLRKDTTGIVLLLAYPCDDEPCAFTRVYFSNPAVTWTAETSTAEFSVQFNPALSGDGTYIFRIAASDVNGNLSGKTPYEIAFQVKQESTLVFEKPFPNPFNYKTEFTFTLTGDDLPSTMNLEILTSTGRPVHAFTIDDPNAFSIGTNHFSWNGIDETGFALQNGVYLYRLNVVVNGRSFNQVGKIVLVR